MNDDDKPRLEIDWVKAFGGALAAVSTAVLLSTLGAAGTLVGAAVGSLALTVSSALYSQGLARSKQRLAVAQDLALQKVNRAQSEVRRANRAPSETATDAHLASAEEQLDEARSELDDAVAEPEPLTWRERLTLLPWKRIALVAAAFFLVAMLAITAFELIAGRTVSSITGGSDSKGGTSISRVTGDGSKNDRDDKRDDKDEKPSDGSTSSDEPSSEPTEADSSQPSESPTEEETTQAPTEPTEAPSEEPLSTPTEVAPPSPDATN